MLNRRKEENAAWNAVCKKGDNRSPNYIKEKQYSTSTTQLYWTGIRLEVIHVHSTYTYTHTRTSLLAELHLTPSDLLKPVASYQPHHISFALTVSELRIETMKVLENISLMSYLYNIIYCTNHWALSYIELI